MTALVGEEEQSAAAISVSGLSVLLLELCNPLRFALLSFLGRSARKFSQCSLVKYYGVDVGLSRRIFRGNQPLVILSLIRNLSSLPLRQRLFL